MIGFLWKGIVRDRSRSLFPVLIVAAGVTLTVFMHAYIHGAIGMMIGTTAHFQTGHVRVTTIAYDREADQIPNDLALIGVDTVLVSLRREFSDIVWTPRIRFGGLFDVPDEKGETKFQSPVAGIGVDLFSADSIERRILNIDQAIVRGSFPSRAGEILLADDLARRLSLEPGATATLIGSTMYGSMTTVNFTVAGTIRFGVSAMDRGMIIADIADIQQALDMTNAAGEIVGFLPGDQYDDRTALECAQRFNAKWSTTDEFAPIMSTLRNSSGMGEYLDLIDAFGFIIVGIFIGAMSIVLWNTGLTGSLRRYGEIGVRIAIGEEKGHVYRSMLVESVFIGAIGSITGTLVGLLFAYYLQEHGLNIAYMTKNTSMMLADIIRARITPFTYAIGFLPGIGATLLGTMISGIGIYKRQTAQLFKELET